MFDEPTPRLRVTAVGLAGLSLGFLLTFDWAHEALRPWRDAADPNEFAWAMASIGLGLAAAVADLLAGPRRRRWELATPWVYGTVLVLWVVIGFLLAFAMATGGT